MVYQPGEISMGKHIVFIIVFSKSMFGKALILKDINYDIIENKTIFVISSSYSQVVIQPGSLSVHKPVIC